MAGTDMELSIIFNYFDQVPDNFLEAMKDISNWMGKDSGKGPVEGLLMENVDQTDKWVNMNYAMFNTEDHVVFRAKPGVEGAVPPKPIPGQPPSDAALFGKVIDEAFKGKQTRLKTHPGGFKEVETYSATGDTIPTLPKKPANLTTTAFLMVPFPTSEGDHFTKENWKEETGANFVIANIPLELALRRITFHRRFTATGDFIAVMLCELSDALSNLELAKEFVGKFRELKKGDSPALMKVLHPYWAAA